MRPALLYHHMDVRKALTVLAGDAMPGRFRHHDPVSGAYLQGNSFSRNPTMGVRPTDCVRITVDRDALARRHRIVPFDSDAAFERYRRFLKDDGQVDWDEYGDYWNAYDLDPAEADRRKNGAGLQWAEEFVVGDIRELHRYVTSVEVNHLPHPRWATMRAAALAFGRRHGVPVEADPAPQPVPQGTGPAFDYGALRAVPVLRDARDDPPLDIPAPPAP